MEAGADIGLLENGTVYEDFETVLALRLMNL